MKSFGLSTTSNRFEFEVETGAIVVRRLIQLEFNHTGRAEYEKSIKSQMAEGAEMAGGAAVEKSQYLSLRRVNKLRGTHMNQKITHERLFFNPGPAKGNH